MESPVGSETVYSASLVKGRCPEGAEGFAVTYYEFALDLGEFVLLTANSPVKNRFRRADFCQPPLGKGAFAAKLNYNLSA